MNVLNVLKYGAVGDGSTDDTAAIQAAIDAADAGNVKVVYFPNPSSYYKCNSQLTLKGLIGLTLLGNIGGDRGGREGTRPTLVYTGTSAPFVDLAQSRGCSLLGLGFQVSNASFTGDIVNTDWSTGGGTVTFSPRIEDCYFGGRTAAAPNARSGIHLAGTVTANISRCDFHYTDYGVIGHVGGDTISFSNDVTIQRCNFDFLNEYGIAPDNGIQWNILGNVFEQSVDDKPAGIKTAFGGTLQNGINIIGNGFWDATVAGTYIDLTAAYGAVIQGNYFELRGVNTGITLRDGCSYCVIQGNTAGGSSGSTWIDCTGTASTNIDDNNNNLAAAVTQYGHPNLLGFASKTVKYLTSSGSARFVGYTSSTSTPTTTELPNSLDWCLHNNTTGPTIYLAFNIGGTIKKVTLS